MSDYAKISVTEEYKTASKLFREGDLYANKGGDGVLSRHEYNYLSILEARNKAVEFYSKGIEICSYWYFYKERAIFYYNVCEYMKCIKDCTEGLKQNVNVGDLYEMRAFSKRQLGDLRGAIEDYVKLVNGKGDYKNYSSYYEDMAEIKIQLKDFKGAFEDYREAIDYCDCIEGQTYDEDDDGNYSVNHTYGDDDDERKKYLLMILANLKFQNGDKIGACKCWSEAGELGEEEAYFYIRNNCN